jgi:hypothetical protein
MFHHQLKAATRGVNSLVVLNLGQEILVAGKSNLVVRSNWIGALRHGEPCEGTMRGINKAYCREAIF